MSAAIDIRGLRKSWDTRAVLRGVNLAIQPGERVALVGPNGSGKTTLLRSVLGFVKAEGWVRVADADPWTDHARAMKNVAYVPQRAPALAAPVGDLVEAWASLRETNRSKVESVALAFGLDLHALGTVRFAALSGGMQQKLLAAMALASGASVLLFDEPTANLDPNARAVFLDLVARLAPRPAILLSSHRMEELTDLVDRVVVLAEGEVCFDDRLDVLFADPDLARSAGLVSTAIPFRRPR